MAWNCIPLDPVELVFELESFQKTIINRKAGEEFELVEWVCFTFHALDFSHCPISRSLRESVNMSHTPARTPCARPGTVWISFQNWLEQSLLQLLLWMFLVYSGINKEGLMAQGQWLYRPVDGSGLSLYYMFVGHVHLVVVFFGLAKMLIVFNRVLKIIVIFCRFKYH